MEDHCKRSRKSAPVKNAVFVGAMHKERSRIYPLRDQNPIIAEQTEVKQYCLSMKTETRGRKPRVSENPIHSRTPVRMSTPVRSCRTSPRYKTRNRSKHENDSTFDSSRSVLSSIGSRRRYHPNYDPLIEIRRAQERLGRYRTHGDWKVDMLLCDDADEDLHRYEEKVKRRVSDRVSKGELMEPIELETRQMELLRRQRDIDMGKVTERYAEYVLSIPKPERQRYHPRTPNKFRKVSRRAWDGMIRKWRKHLHNFDDLNFEESWRSLSTADLSATSSISSPHSISDGAVSSDSENVNPIRLSQQSFSLTAEFKSHKALTASPTVKMTVKHETFQYRTQEDEEDTLQGQPKVRRDHAASNVRQEDEDTLSGMPTVYDSRRITRNSRGCHGPSADVLHSGLTNDMHSLTPAGQKRSGSHLNHSDHKVMTRRQQPLADVNNLMDFPALQTDAGLNSVASPSKRMKRGILTQNGLI